MDGMNTSQVQQVQKREARGKGMENADRKAGPSTAPITGTMDRTRFSQLSSSIHFWAHKPLSLGFSTPVMSVLAPTAT